MSDSNTSKTFDPYHTWLGIPPDQQPAHHYRLLGLELFESNPDVIDIAANRQVAYLRQVGTGEHRAMAKSLCKQIVDARLVLIDEAARVKYDAKLKKLGYGQTESSGTVVEPPPPPSDTSGFTPVINVGDDAAPVKTTKTAGSNPDRRGSTTDESDEEEQTPQGAKRRKKDNAAWIMVGGTLAAAILIAGGVFIMQKDPDPVQSTSVASNNNPVNPIQDAEGPGGNQTQSGTSANQSTGGGGGNTGPGSTGPRNSGRSGSGLIGNAEISRAFAETHGTSINKTDGTGDVKPAVTPESPQKDAGGNPSPLSPSVEPLVPSEPVLPKPGETPPEKPEPPKDTAPNEPPEPKKSTVWWNEELKVVEDFNSNLSKFRFDGDYKGKYQLKDQKLFVVKRANVPKPEMPPFILKNREILAGDAVALQFRIPKNTAKGARVVVRVADFRVATVIENNKLALRIWEHGKSTTIAQLPYEKDEGRPYHLLVARDADDATIYQWRVTTPLSKEFGGKYIARFPEKKIVSFGGYCPGKGQPVVWIDNLRIGKLSKKLEPMGETFPKGFGQFSTQQSL